jgi:hypothetical protein
MIVPTTRPDLSGSASEAANGISTWAATEKTPATAIPTASVAKLGANPLTA